MAASRLAHAKTGRPAGLAPASSSMAHSGTRRARQSVARRAGLTTFRQYCGISAMSGDLWGGSLSRGRRVVSQSCLLTGGFGPEVLA